MIKSEQESMSSMKFLLLFILGGAILGIIGSFGQLILSQKPPYPLPPAPNKVVKLTETGFIADMTTENELWGVFPVHPVVITVESKHYEFKEYKDSWVIYDGHLLDYDYNKRKCGKKAIRNFENKIDEAINCKGVQPGGDFCSGPITYFALSPEGDVWKYVDNKFCPTISFISASVFGYIGAFIASMIEGTRTIRQRWKRNHV